MSEYDATGFNRRHLLRNAPIALGALSLAVAGQLRAATTPGDKRLVADNTAGRISTERVLQINVKLGPEEDMGKGADGHRINYPIVGGHFAGQGLSGTVIPGGADMSVERDDGVTLIEALYRLKTDDGHVLIIHNPGIWRPNEAGKAKLAKGQTPAAEDYYCRTTPSFKTPPGRYAWLSDFVFVGTIDDVADDEVLIGCYRVEGV
ncbi:DUF3237 domain-containing protein [Pseudomonas japonica]|uniref:DUF3237 domain-containing protein n=1 Tax=Pseudomonas japonica TaxID=256466 RepID=UPI0015E48BA7|nr:DUF3237 domain-containing protein [Pseudomonas japonica]MBA1243320.1 DUF3237 domain-containing protein [Pseudomonas japonica]MBA1290332.1 DUF3237 domain-containing protein [Pseudomonas japonica]